MTHRAEGNSTPDKGKNTPGSLPPEPVEDRPGVGVVKPEDYPDAVENDATGSGIQSPPGLDDDMDFERRNPGS